jgi:hypothetical protein
MKTNRGLRCVTALYLDVRVSTDVSHWQPLAATVRTDRSGVGKFTERERRLTQAGRS